MNEMNRKKWYIWQLGRFLHGHGMTMSGQELADHLNRNNFRTGYGTEFEGARGTYTIIDATWRWVNDDLGLGDEANGIAMAFVKPDGTHAWSNPDETVTAAATVSY